MAYDFYEDTQTIYLVQVRLGFLWKIGFRKIRFFFRDSWFMIIIFCEDKLTAYPVQGRLGFASKIIEKKIRFFFVGIVGL